MAIFNTNIHSMPAVAYERYSELVTYAFGEYTDVIFNIAKDGYVPINIMPRTSGRKEVVLVGYGFGETDQAHQVIDRNTATITFNNISDADINGTAKLDVVYMKTQEV